MFDCVQPPFSKDDPFYLESYQPEAEEKIPPSSHVEGSAGVQDVGPIQSGPVSSTGNYPPSSLPPSLSPLLEPFCIAMSSTI